MKARQGLNGALQRATASWRRLTPLGKAVGSATLAVALLGAVAAFFVSRDDQPPACSDRFCIEVIGPEGDDTDPMMPVRIRLTGEIDRQAAIAALRISNAPAGTTAFDGDLLTFRPDWPGFARGVRYEVGLALDAPALPRGVEPVEVSFRFTVGGKLLVSAVFPAEGTREVQQDAEVFVQFSRSVAPLSVLAERGPQGVLEFDPPVEGMGRWLSTSLYVFQPEPGWQPASIYSGRVKAGLTNLLGAQLDDDFVFHFTTVSPDVAAVTPADNSKFVGPLPEIKVEFNQPVDRRSAEERFSIRSAGAGQQVVAGDFEWPSDAILVFRPSAPLPLASRFEAMLSPGVAGLGSTIATTRDVRWSFATTEPPRVTSTLPAEGAQNAAQYGVRITFATPMDRRSVEDNLVIEPKPENAPYFGWEPSDLVLQAGVGLQPSTAYRVRLSTAAVDRYGHHLSEPLDLSFTADRISPAVRMFRSGPAGTFNAYLDPTVMVSSWNVERVDFKLYRIDRGQFLERLTQRKEALAQTNLVREWSETLTKPPLNKPVVTSARLDGDQRLTEGFYVVTVTGPGVRGGDELPFVLSSVNLTTKWTDDDLLVWALDLQSGAPFSGWRFDVLNRSGDPIARGTTDASGIAKIDVKGPGDNYYPGYFVVAERDGRVVFASTIWSEGINPYNYGGGIGFDFSLPPLVGHLYTDRPIYRPGETVYLKGVVRQDHDTNYTLPDGLQLEARIADDQGRQVDRQTVTLSDMGTFDTSLALSAEAATGIYNVSLWPQGSAEAGRYGAFAGASFRVAEFRKPEFEVSVSADQESYVNGEQINATLSAQLFFGAPLPNAEVRWRVTGSRYTFRSSAFSSYQTGEYRVLFGCMVASVPEFEGQRYFRQEGTGRTDAEGRFHFSFPADVAGDSFSQNFMVEAWVTDQNQQQVTDFISVPVHKGRFYIGLRPAEYAPRTGRETRVELVTIDPLNATVANIPVEVSIYERKWRTVRERDAAGQQRYVSVSEDIFVETIAARTGANGQGSFAFSPPRSGQYYLVAKSRDNRGNPIQSSLVLWASGGEYASWHIPNDDRFTLVADKDEYRPGDTARILVAAPFAGESIALITQERGSVLAYETRTLRSNSEVLELPIVSTHLPNFFVSVVLFQPPTPENPLPKVKFGLVQLKVSAEEKKLNITIEPNASRLKPRDTVTYRLRTTDSAGRGVPAEVSLALVDKAVLSLQDDLSRPAAQAFWSQRPLSVLTGSTFTISVDRANELAKVLYPGGKGGGGGIADQTRTFFPNTAFWDPKVRTDSSGRATIEVPLPDTLTTWRLTARGVTPDTKVGEASNEVVASKDLIVRPVLPRFLVAGDEAEIGAIVNNLGRQRVDAEVSIRAEGLAIAGDASQTRSIPPGGSAIVHWTAKAPLEPVEARLVIDAAASAATDSVSMSLPVHAYFTPETVATGGEVTHKATEAVQVPSYVLPDAGGLTVNVTPSIVAGVKTGYRYLEEYPWESSEMTVSRLVAALSVERSINELGLEDIAPVVTDTRPLVQRSLQKLYKTQKTDGGWGWWSREASDPAMTAYVLIGLGEAKRTGFSVDAGVEGRATGYLVGQLSKSRDVLKPEYDLRAFILYAMARDQRGDLGRSYALAEQRVSLSNTAKARLALAIKLSGGNESDPRLTSLLTDLQTAAIASATGSHWEDERYDRSVLGSNSASTTAQVLQALAALQPENPLIDGAARWLMVARKDGHWECSYDTATALLAITDFMLVRRDVQGSFDYRVRLNGQSLLQGEAEAGRVNQEQSVIVPLRELATDALNDLLLERVPAGAPGRLYYTAQLRYFTPASDILALNRGVAVSHEYYRADSDSKTPVHEVQLGDVVRVKVTLVAPADLNYLVVEDFLPAGLEPVDTGLKITPLEFRQRMAEEARRSYQASRRYSPFGHVDMRDDRVALFARFVARGVYEYSYYARATTAGNFHVPPAVAYEQYFPEVFGRSDGGTFIVRAATAD